MWVLVPLPRSDSQSAGQQSSTHIYLTACGNITVGRPLKKGSTVGKADILIFNEQSVSSIHAKLQVEAPAVHGSFTHGTISITDISKFGTHLARSGATPSPEIKLTLNEPVQLQPGDILRFGSNSRYQLQQVPLVLVASSSCLSRHPQLQQQASTLNAQLTSSWQVAAAAAAGPAAEVYHVADAEAVMPCLLRSLLEGKPLVTPAWVAAAAARKAWVGDLPPPGEYSPERLLLPVQQQEGAAAGQSELILSDWRVPGGDLLAGFTLMFEQGCQDDLVAAAAACGAQHEELPSRPTKQQLVAQRQQAAHAGRTAVLVHCSDWGADTGVLLQQQSQQSAGREHLPVISELQLLLAIAQHTAQHLQDAAAAFAAEHSLQEQPPQPAAAGTAAAGGAGTVDDDEEADGTEADETEAEEDTADDPAAAAAATATPGPAAVAGPAAAGGRLRASPKGVPVRSKLLPASPTGAAAATSTGAGLRQSAAGWHQHSTSTGTAHGHATGTKRAAAAAASSEALEAPSSTRHRTAAGTSPGKAPLQLQQQPPPLPGASGLAQQPAGGRADASRPPAASADPQGQQQQELGCSEQITVQLCLTTPVQRPAVIAVGDQQVPNYKAFRRRDQAQPQQQQQGQQQRLNPPAVELVVADAQNLQGADIDTFLRDEKHRMERLRKADELFHANLKPSKAPPLTKPAARARKK